ncbi:uncharacterized protein LOC123557260 isoform X2 [Mercenaria mercenaria]|uniref:uncharacterized protein LOC123557260 isoform X2 n=1 Tax=Mercenaria mercenaria TaxID=6596 RepID=UPI00234FB49B|nr:uncharacterized protein LOC123557260 isoform X2 [Mercenaria mercenaria]
MSESPTFRRRSNRGSDPQHSGYVSMEDDNLEHSGVRGGRSCCLCTLIIILLLVAVLNALVTAGLIYFLSVTHEGMLSLEFFPGGKYLRVLSDVAVENLTLHDQLVGRSGKDITISGHEVVVGLPDGAKLTIDGNKTYLTSDKFELKTEDGKPLFATGSPLNLDLYQVKNLRAPAIDVGSVTSSSKFPDLLIESFDKAYVKGMEGVQVETQENIEIVAPEKAITFNSLQDSLKFNQEEGIFMDPNLPLDGKGSSSKNGNQLKLCVCGSNGRVFAVPDLGDKSGCHFANEDRNPCLD